jgi:hypothetical protein
MARMGHDSLQAAVIYQHATTRADCAIAAALDVQLQEARRGPAGSAQDFAERGDGRQTRALEGARSLVDRSAEE